MPVYIVCIGINSLHPEDYRKLNAIMRGFGFKRKIKGDRGNSYELPAAVFHKYDQRDKDFLIEVITAKLDLKFVKPWILVINYEGIVWQNLPLV